MNVLAGVAIGWVSPWPIWLISPFLWGLVWCWQKWAQSEHEDYVEAVKDRRLKWNLGPVVSFYLIEYMTATSTSLFFAVITGVIRNLLGVEPVLGS